MGPPGVCCYLRRETRRAVRRPVRRATLRDPNISFLLVVVDPGQGGQLAAADRAATRRPRRPPRSISASANVVTIARRRSGLACASCSSSQPDTSITGSCGHRVAPSHRDLGSELNENHAVAAFTSRHAHQRKTGHHIRGRNPNSSEFNGHERHPYPDACTEPTREARWRASTSATAVR